MEDNQIFSYEKDKLFNDDIKRYLNDIGKIPMFSSNFEGEKRAGEELVVARESVLKKLIGLKPSKDQETIEKFLYLLQNQNIDCDDKSYRQFCKDLDKIENIWDFLSVFINRFGQWPSFKKLKQKFGEISLLVFKVRFESLKEEVKLCLFLEKNMSPRSQDFIKLHEKIFLKISKNFAAEEYRKYWRAQLFDELEVFPNLPKRLAKAVEGLCLIEKKFVEANLRFAVIFAKKFFWACASSKLDFLDLIQEGNLGLFYAARRFDPKQGYKFTTFAGWWVRQSIQRSTEDDSNTIKIPVHAIEKYKKVSKISKTITQVLGKIPTAEDIAREISQNYPDLKKELDKKTLTGPKVEKILSVGLGVDSLDRSADGHFGFDDSDSDSTLGTFIECQQPSPEDEILKSDLRQNIRKILKKVLTPKETEIINLRMGLIDGIPHTLEEIGGEFCVTREYIRQIEERAIMKLRRSPKKEILRHFVTMK